MSPHPRESLRSSRAIKRKKPGALAEGQTNETNIAPTTSWAPSLGGATTFSDTLAVVSVSLRATLSLQGSSAILNWTGGAPPYRVQGATELTSEDWTDVLTNAIPPVSLSIERTAEFYRIVAP